MDPGLRRGDGSAPRRWSIAISLLLAACGSEKPVGAPQGGMAEAALNTVGNETAAAPAADVTAVPPAFLGRWGQGPADCDPARTDNKGLMIVEADRLRFYESRATLARGRTEGADRLVATLAFSGEGQSWTEETVLTLADGGRTLVRAATGSDTPLLRYARCPS